MVSEFAKQFVEMEEESARLKTELAAAKASAEEANKLAASARMKVDVLEKDIGKLRKNLEKELKAKEAAKTSTEDREERLRKAIESLLGKSPESLRLLTSFAYDLSRVVD